MRASGRLADGSREAMNDAIHDGWSAALLLAVMQALVGTGRGTGATGHPSAPDAGAVTGDP
jgi:hypothetical protein